MTAYILAGLVLGGIYAISASAMVVTYVSMGILNFAFGAMAFFIARLYYFLLVEQGWSIPAAAFVSIGVAAPLLGVALYYALFRLLSRSSALTKVVATIGLSVTIPAVAQLIFGTAPILSTPGLAPKQAPVIRIAGTAITMDQLIAYACTIAVLILGWWVLQRTKAGLLVRATVDSEAMTSLSGTNPGRVAVVVSAVSTALAGLAGILAGPIFNVDSVGNYTLLTASAFAAVVAARLRSLPLAVLVGLLMGVMGALIQWAMPESSTWTFALIASVPFVIVVVSLTVYTIRGHAADRKLAGGALDAAIAVVQEGKEAAVAKAKLPLAARLAALIPNNTFVVFCAILPLLVVGYHVGLVGQAIALGIIFLSYTLLTGQGGMISLCQITFAGVGAMATAQLATVYDWPVLVAVLAGALIAGALGLIVGLLTVRMGNLYVALATLTFGLLMSTLVFDRERFYQSGAGVSITRPDFLTDDLAFTYFSLAVFVALGLGIHAVRLSTTGLSLAAIRSTETGAKTVGISVLRTKVIISMMAAAVAGLGGGMFAMYSGAAIPAAFDAVVGLVWFAVLVTHGVKTNNAALASGLLFVFLPDLLSQVLTDRWMPLPTALFGLGAILLAKNPGGVITMNGELLTELGRKIVGLVRRLFSGGSTPSPVAVSAGSGSTSVPSTAKESDHV